MFRWSGREDSNLRPPGPEPGSLTSSRKPQPGSFPDRGTQTAHKCLEELPLIGSLGDRSGDAIRGCLLQIHKPPQATLEFPDLDSTDARGTEISSFSLTKPGRSLYPPRSGPFRPTAEFDYDTYYFIVMWLRRSGSLSEFRGNL